MGVLIASFISSYGYLALFIGTFLEGESVLIMAGIAAYAELLSLKYVLIFGFLGSIFGDWFCFYLGRYHGRSFVEKRPALQKRIEKVYDLLHKHQVLLMLGFRFLYGFRIITPFALGMSEVKTYKFVLYNLFGAFSWTIIFGLGGYTFGTAMEGMFKNFEIKAIIIIAVLAFVLWIWTLLRNRRIYGESAGQPIAK